MYQQQQIRKIHRRQLCRKATITNNCINVRVRDTVQLADRKYREKITLKLLQLSTKVSSFLDIIARAAGKGTPLLTECDSV